MKLSRLTATFALIGGLTGLLGGCPIAEQAAPEGITGTDGPAGKLSTPDANNDSVAPEQTAVNPTPTDLTTESNGPLPDGSESAPWAWQFGSTEPQPWGTWLLESGGMLPTFVAGLATFSTTTDVTALILNEDGTGRVLLRDRLTGAKDCVRVYVLYDGETMVLDFAAEPTSDVVYNLAIEDYTYFFPVVVAEEDALGIAAEDGHIALFSRQTELPPEVACGELEVIDVFEGLPEAQFFSDMVLYNGDLVYSSSSNIESFDLDTDTLGTPLGATSSRLVQTTEDGYLWTHCGCGGSRDAYKRTLSTVVDTVSSEDEMGGPITFRAMAYNATTDRLWLHGRSFDSQYGQFYVMNTNGEPDTIDQTLAFNRDLRALTFDGAELWGIVTVASQAVVHIDPSTGKVIESYEVPDEDVSWSGLVFDDDYMYMLGETLDNEGVIYRLARE